MEKSNSTDILPPSKKQIQNKKTFNFYTLKNGSQISCHGRPKESDIKRLKEEYKVNYILTIQHENEKPETIKKYTEEIKDITWHNLPLKGANMAIFMNKEVQKMIINNILILLNVMKKNKIVLFIHCAAGIHRTGTILYTILRLCDESIESSMEAIKFIRLDTFRKCGDNRLKYAEEFLVQPLMKIWKCNDEK